jgi:hypothetical protein
MDVKKERTRNRSPRHQTWSIQSPHDDTPAGRHYLSSRMSLTQDRSRRMIRTLINQIKRNVIRQPSGIGHFETFRCASEYLQLSCCDGLLILLERLHMPHYLSSSLYLQSEEESWTVEDMSPPPTWGRAPKRIKVECHNTADRSYLVG